MGLLNDNSSATLHNRNTICPHGDLHKKRVQSAAEDNMINAYWGYCPYCGIKIEEAK